MRELDGEWKVERVGGLLPPLLGVRKRISGDRGETRVAGVTAAPFAVAGLELRYLKVFRGFIDVLEPEEDGFSGRSTFRGREFARFRMRRA
jgi:hypothetical protein